MSRGGRQWPINDHDVLGGRGVSISQHAGNERFRALVLQRSDAEYCNTYTTNEKKQIAAEIVDQINSLDPPGRFLKRIVEGRKSKSWSNRNLAGEWEELTAKEAIKKTCQALRDCNRRDRTGYGANVLMSGNLPPDVEEVRQTHAESGTAERQPPGRIASTSKRKAEDEADIFPQLTTLQGLATPHQPIAQTQEGNHPDSSHTGLDDFNPSLASIDESRSSFKKHRHMPEVTPSTLGVASAASAAAMDSSPDHLTSVFGDASSFEPISGFDLSSTFDGDSKPRASSFDDSKQRAPSIGDFDVDEAYASFSAEAQDFGPPSPPYDPDHPSYHHDT